MKRSMLSAIAAGVMLSSAGAFAAASTTTTTTWTDEYGNIIREHSTTKLHEPIIDPKLDVTVGTALPNTIAVYPLPETIRVPQPERYSYVIINDDPVVVEKDTRRVVHVWAD